MTVLVVPDPYALATREAESLASVIGRTARIYCVKSSRVARLCALVSNPSVRAASYKSLDRWLGNNTGSRSLLYGLESLSGRGDLALTGLYKLDQVVGHGRGLLASSLRVCPDCVHPERGSGYGMLCHQMQYVTRCPKHETPLNDRCLSCGSKFAPYQDLLPGAVCSRCHLHLWDQHRFGAELSRYERWCEVQVLDLVAYVTSPEKRDALVGWSDLYLRALTQLAGAEPELYTCGERRRISDLLKAAVRKSVRLPSFSTLLRISAMQAVSLVDLIRAPVESCSPRLCRIGPATGPAVTRGKTDSESWLRAKGALLRELHSNATLRSKNSILTELGLSVSGFWQHYPDLAVKYEIERLTRLNHRRDVHKDAALSAARRLVSEAAETGVCPTVRRGGEQVRLETGASKQVSEDAMRFVLREHDAGRYRG